MSSTCFSSTSSPSCCCRVIPNPNTTTISSYFPTNSLRRRSSLRPPNVSASLSSTKQTPPFSLPLPNPPLSTTTLKVSLPSNYLFLNFTTATTTKSNHFSPRAASSDSDIQVDSKSSPSPSGVNSDLETNNLLKPSNLKLIEGKDDDFENAEIQIETSSLLMLLGVVWEWGLLISPFFFWGTAMVAMKEVLPKAGPFFVSSFRLIPAGFLLVAFAALRGRSLPSGLNAWVSIILFAVIDAACFQGFLAEGLERTSAGLGSVIIDSQPLTVAILAALLYGESIGFVGAAGLVLGVVGLLLLELPALAFDENNFSLWGSGEWWMLLAAQSMAVGTVMFRWVSKYSDPIMATGWHMVIGGLPLAAISVLNHDPAISGGLEELTSNDVLALLYTSIFGSAISYGVFFYNATRGSLTKLSSLTFLTPMFASVFGFLYLGETFSTVQLTGALVTIVAIYMVNYKNALE